MSFSPWMNPSVETAPSTNQPASSYTTAANPVAQAMNPSPQYLSQIFSAGLPQVSAAQVSGANAAPGASIDASQYGSNAMTKEILNAMSPVFQQQQKALTDNLANAGIVGGSTAGAVGDLANTQITQLLGQLAPIQSAANQQQLGAQEFTSGQTQQNNQFNANANQSAQLANQSSVNGANNTNVTNALSAGQFDTQTYNNLLSAILGYQNEGYLQNQQDQYGLATGAAGGQQQAFTPIYQQPGQGLMGDAMSMAGTYFGSQAGAGAAAAAAA